MARTTYDVVTEVTDADADELWPVYDGVFGDQPDQSGWRHDVWDRHTARPGFRLARVRTGQELVGFCYGYTGEHGQWWTDQMTQVLPPEVADEWLGGHFELVSIGVLPAARRAGLGTGLLRALCDGLAQERWLLMTTADDGDPARRLYAREGWQVIGPGLADGQVTMGRLRRR